MARRSRGLGLNAYFGYTAFDLDTNRIREGEGREYLRHRLDQVDRWMGYLARRLGNEVRRTGAHSVAHPTADCASQAMDYAYLQAMRRELCERLKTH